MLSSPKPTETESSPTCSSRSDNKSPFHVEKEVYAGRSKLVCGIRWTKKILVIILAALVVLIVAFALIAVFVVAPHIAQLSIDGSEIALTSASITNMAEKTFQISGAGTVSDAGTIDATLSFPTPVTVFWTNRDGGGADLPLGTLQLPPISVSGASPKSGAFEFATEFQVSSKDNMAQFAASMLNSAEFSWLLSGVATGKALGLSVTEIQFSKVVTLPGFDGFQSISIDSFDLDLFASNSGFIPSKAVATICNPATTSIELGNVSFDLFDTDMASIGFFDALDVKMVPGNNTVPMTGAIQVADSSKLFALMNSFLFSGEGLDTIIVGNRSSIDSSWFNAALRQLKMNVNVPPSKLGSLMGL
ncbi:hypothetical protein HDU98_003187 [Podochytrium sp. JEL0797]|nr:hypothetical protein HDU98_003187 [Podochytrium sp. JEL0797]